MKYLKPFLALLLLFLLKLTSAQEISEVTNEYSFDDHDFNSLNIIIKNSEGNFICAGYHTNMIVTCINLSGEVLWDKSYGGVATDYPESIIETSDGEYLILGYSNSVNIIGHHSKYDYWLIKLNSEGELVWQRCYGGSEDDIAVSILERPDGGFILCGYTNSNDGNVNNYYGNKDIWLVTINDNGAIESQKTLGGSGEDVCYSMDKNPYGGYIISGGTNSIDGDVEGYQGSGPTNAWILKINEYLNIEWQYVFDQYPMSASYDITIDTQGDILSCGNAKTDPNSYNYDTFLLTKLSNFGEIEWQKSDLFIPPAENISTVANVISTLDGGYILTGTVVTEDDLYWERWSDIIVLKTDESGIIEWQYIYGSYGFDAGNHIIESARNNYAIVGEFGYNTHYMFSKGFFTQLCVDEAEHITIKDSTYTYSTELIAPSGYHSYNWNTGDTTQSITITEGGAYGIDVSSGFSCGEQLVIEAPDPQMPQHNFQPCLVTVDEQSNKNLLVYRPIQEIGVDSVMIYKFNEGLNIYRNIATLPVENEGLFLDEDSYPNQKSESYKIALKDTAGIISDKSLPQSTVYLEGYIGVSNNVQLSWSDFEGFDFANFKVYRSVDESDFELIATLSNQNYQYTDVAPPEGEKKYKIVVDKEIPCEDDGFSYSNSVSNTILLSPLDVNSIECLESINVYPNPFSSVFKVEFHKPHPEVLVELLDTYGRVVASKSVDKNQHESTFSIPDKAKGMYFVQVDGVVVEKVIKK